ncbi:claudin-15 isoform X3 [Sciurus carolinensis]|uniref:claudin-15 isoform X3 n=1 Tax=Sciurus carolinensis TaxID=30640 RepID=UPI001FB55F3B|nr:claudin-15 isoform X3 [Sciurus carolinensis]
MSIAVETFGFFMAALGLLMLGVTLPNSYWRVSSVHGNVITTSTIFENLWYSCATDSMGVSNCWEFPSMLALSGILGLRCTTIGGMDLSRKAKLAAIAGALHILAGQSGNCPVPDVKSSERGLRDGSHLLVRRQHHAGLLQPPLRWNQVRAGPCPLPGLERLPALHPGWHLPRLHLLLCLPGGPHCKGPASLQSFRSFCSRDARHDLGRR